MAHPLPTVTPEGTEIYIEPLPHVRSCSVGFWVRRGSRHEGAAEEGLAHFLEHTVFKGTEAYPTPDELAAATDRLGGHVDAFTGKEVACFYGKVLAEQLPELVHLLGELLTAPRFDPEELVRERSVILEEIAQSEDQPDDWVSELFYGGFWEGTPLAHPILGRPEQVAEYGAREARAFFDHTYRAPNLVVAAAGDIAEGPFLELLQPILDRLPKATAHAPEVLAQSRPFLRNVRRKDLQQASLVLGFPAPGHRSPDRAATHLLSHVLGGGMASRLFLELRERRGLCYQVGSYLAPTPTPAPCRSAPPAPRPSSASWCSAPWPSAPASATWAWARTSSSGPSSRPARALSSARRAAAAGCSAWPTRPSTRAASAAWTSRWPRSRPSPWRTWRAWRRPCWIPPSSVSVPSAPAPAATSAHRTWSPDGLSPGGYLGIWLPQ